jgi:hypothetical protein
MQEFIALGRFTKGVRDRAAKALLNCLNINKLKQSQSLQPQDERQVYEKNE